jgi:predicted RNase H-like HicB family nuclease
MNVHVHEEVLRAAKQIASQRGDWTFAPYEVVQALPTLNESSVRTDIVSRCCINAPKNHLRQWDYFRRVGHGRYEVRSKYRDMRIAATATPTISTISSDISRSERTEFTHPARRDVIHAVIHAGEDAFTAECLEVAAVTQGNTLDEVVRNLNEALALFLEGEDLAALGLSDQLRVQMIFEMPLSR